MILPSLPESIASLTRIVAGSKRCWLMIVSFRTGLPLHPDHAVARLASDLHRLLDHHVLARPHGPDRVLGVQARRRADADHVDVRVGQEFFVAGVNLRQAELGSQIRRALGDEVGDRDQFRLVDPEQRPRMRRADPAAPDQSKPKLHRPL